ncbi:MAG: esterase-like activity of phytase family protein [Planctomycetia bacterium]|nr:esterase-like activity of phytase family protein [Planctomycetia bacterium]
MVPIHRSLRIFPFLALLVAVCCMPPPALADIVLLGTARFAGDTTDLSGLTDVLDEGIPHNRLGGISAIEYTGSKNEYLLLPDRGPRDGATRYFCRIHTLKLDVRPGGTPAVAAKIAATTLLRDERGRNLVGSASAFKRKNPAAARRFDPEAVRVGLRGSIYLSDEYGPAVSEFTQGGTRVGTLKVPAKFTILHPASKPEEELAQNSSGRQPNGGLEGLAIIPRRTKLYAAMQRPLIQDSLPGEGVKRTGTNTRIIEFDLTLGTTREFLYVLDNTANGVSEILAINDHEFLVLERDGKPGTEAVAKRIYKIDLARATDISSHESLPPEGVPVGVKAAAKSLFLDLLDPRWGLAGPDFPEKVEGLAFGPSLPDGRRLLIVAVDNDFVAERPVLLHAFAIDRADLANFGW